MSRTSVQVRAAIAADAPVLRELWSDILRRATDAEQQADVESVIADCADREDRCIAVAELDGHVAGAVFLAASTLTPLNLEPALLAVSPHVLPEFRRRGVGTALMDAAAGFAEHRGIGTVATAAMASSRDANRFMARLSLTPQATLRAASTSAVRAKLSARRSTTRPRGSRQIDKVLAARRMGREHVAS
ncbi:GNAT family N-acetyltransferase [Nocardioides sp. B-3]|uniref:GNAT family N-acetyltransferase n=1 Tax=Nocardioides sp. B-3 TaxID=2895565 RepID=UPI00215245FA|nr:GNAT family N-acetyltransferase [Nocardioides sp. B-3]UUZ58840.1 GNAT family N-acetyltransferase [Nocardioides sp. B-3]